MPPLFLSSSVWVAQPLLAVRGFCLPHQRAQAARVPVLPRLPNYRYPISSVSPCFFLHCLLGCANNLSEYMRRLLRSVFLLLVVATLVAPLPMGETAAAATPICCLGQGEHHCVGQVLGGGPKSLGFSAANKCPYSPLALAAMHGPNLAPPVHAQVIVAAAQSAPLTFESNDSAFFSAIDARPERGPPAFSLN